MRRYIEDKLIREVRRLIKDGFQKIDIDILEDGFIINPSKHSQNTSKEKVDDFDAIFYASAEQVKEDALDS